MRCEKAVRISSALGICPEHEDLNLTSKVNSQTLSNDAKIIISQAKFFEKHEIRKQILKELEDQKNEDEDALMISENLKSENALLRELNRKLKYKNNLLRELLEKQKNDMSTVKNKTYADAFLNTKYSNKIKRVPKLIVKKITEEKTIEKVNECVSHLLIKNKSIQTKRI